MKHEALLRLFAEFLEKQDALSKLTETEELHGYSYSEIHTIDSIGRLETPNATKIAAALGMTRGAIGKIAKRLLSHSLIESYCLPSNKKEVYFRLTDEGLRLYNEHNQRHALWRQRDSAFFSAYSDKELDGVLKFMTRFNAYLGEQIGAVTKDRFD